MKSQIKQSKHPLPLPPIPSYQLSRHVRRVHRIRHIAHIGALLGSLGPEVRVRVQVGEYEFDGFLFVWGGGRGAAGVVVEVVLDRGGWAAAAGAEVDYCVVVQRGGEVG